MTSFSEYLDEDKAEEKYWKEIEKYSEICKFNIHEQDTSDLIDLFYYYNKPDVYEMSITTRTGYTRIQVYHSANNSIVVNLSDIIYTNGLIRAVGKFIEYMAQEYKPIN